MHQDNNVLIRIGDRIIIKNMPKDYPFAGLYKNPITGDYSGVIDKSTSGSSDGDFIITPTITFCTGHVPYKSADKFSCSGSFYSIDREKLKFTERKPALFWNFELSNKSESEPANYSEPVNYFECDFNDIKK